MDFISTRNILTVASGPEAIARGIAPDGGLFVPKTFPVFGKDEREKMLSLDYTERAAKVIGAFLPMGEEKLMSFCRKAYSRFDGDTAPVVKLDESLYVTELWHGPTHAFKDVALTLLPYLLTESKKILGKTDKTLVLVATSGDTGKAALEGFKDVEGTFVTVFYPSEGVSELQKLQMITQHGGNVEVFGIKGNFDDAQTAVKKAFADPELIDKIKAQGYEFSSANSINLGRLVPQITYYFSSYLDLVNAGEIEDGDQVDFCVPSGNFGNILAGYYAKRMGLPIGKLICASNVNNVLTDFIRGGKYDSNREFFKTTSPSMDILVSSNLERLVFELSGRDAVLTRERMENLKKSGTYSITPAELKAMCEDFYADWASEEEVAATLKDYFDEYGYICDTHTSVAMCVLDKYRKATGSETPAVVLSTASPYKFVKSVLSDLGERIPADELKALKKLESITALPVPDSLASLTAQEKLHASVIAKDEINDAVLRSIRSK
jgi:threonine synthase